MNRMTKKIGLVLISSSLTLPGCFEPPVPQQADRPDWNQDDDPAGAASGTGGIASGTGGTSYRHHSGYYGGYPGGYYHYYGGRTGGGAGPSATRPGASSSSPSGSRPGTSSFSSHSGSSSRGGFGGSAHGSGS